MRIRPGKLAALAMACVIPFSAAGASKFGIYLSDGTAPFLREAYAGRMETGISESAVQNADRETTGIIPVHCSLLVCEETMRAKNLLDRGSSKKSGDAEHARLRIGKAAEPLKFAQENGMKVRAATVVQTANIPKWFFNEDWTDTSKARTAGRETVLRRTENAIRDQIGQINGKYPGLVTEWEVIRGGQDPAENLFLQTAGEAYIFSAFRTARESAAEGQKLLWALTEEPDDGMFAVLRDLREQELLDGIVLECRLTMDEAELTSLEQTLVRACGAGLEIHLSGLEFANTDRTAAGQIRLATRYKAVFALAEKYGIRSVSLPALRDEADRDRQTPPRLISEKGKLTAAYFGALQDDAIPLPGDEDAVRAAAEQLDLDTVIKKEADPVIVYKTAENHNPVIVQRFGADPWALAYGDRVYLYMTGDEPVYRPGEKPETNDYSNIVTLRVLSSDDLVNWTDHGSVRAAGGNGAAKWASNSWAPCAAWKNIDGKDRFFLYFANSGGGIGVLTSDSPTGPFTDPIGKPLVSRSTPTCASVTWLFDPAVLTDADGSAYLYFGGGVPEGKQADPGTARVAKLGADMISLDGDPVAINPPWLFEDSGINRFGDTYVYSYCSNFNVPAAGSPQGFGSGEIVYMTSGSPMGPFAYAGRILKNPGSLFGVGGNNHHCMFSFRGEWYITYHAATLDKAMGWNAGYRSVFVDRLELNEAGLPALSKGTYTGVQQLKALDPYAATSGATAISMAGATTELANPEDRKAGTGPMAAVSTTPGGWVAAAGADFGTEGAVSVRVTVRSEVPARIEIIPDAADGEQAAILEVPACDTDTEIREDLAVTLTGIHDLYFRFTESGTSLLEWQFR